ncbi:MAG: hypothetical protein CMF50_06640 [Legionellales bacterium]|nr:hypothetical protein [Legionellales bacterium]|tara:strand:- start:7499 stop:7753 length:255 start_codon:yes stop_codon:yes gene_type:complete
MRILLASLLLAVAIPSFAGKIITVDEGKFKGCYVLNFNDLKDCHVNCIRTKDPDTREEACQVNCNEPFSAKITSCLDAAKTKQQ